MKRIKFVTKPNGVIETLCPSIKKLEDVKVGSSGCQYCDNFIRISKSNKWVECKMN